MYSCIEKPKKSLNPLVHIARWCRNIRYIYQRIRYGYCETDFQNFNDWFMHLIPCMLEDLRDCNDATPYGVFDQQDDDDAAAARREWRGMLTKMATLFRESDRMLCRRKNPYQEEADRIWAEFWEKYGENGERLKSAEEIESEKGGHFTRAHFPDEVPEYKAIMDKYADEEIKIMMYRQRCWQEAIGLFEKRFHELWD